MRVKEITIHLGYTFQPEQFHSVKGEYNYTVELDPDDDLEGVEEEIRGLAMLNLKQVLTEVTDLHNQVTSGDAMEALAPTNSSWDEDDDDVLF